MGDYEPVYALDKVRLSVQVPIELAIKINKRAKEKGVSMSHYATTILYAATHKDPWTIEDEQLRNKIFNENILKREAAKKRRNARAKKEGR